MQISEQKLRPLIQQLEVKASVIEHEIQKLQRATTKVIVPEINLLDLEDMMQKVVVNAGINQGIVDTAQNDMQALQEKIEAIDFSFSEEIKIHVDELETLLVAIAADLN